MAIKGITDQRSSFPMIGKLRKGSPKSANAPGRDLQSFRFDSKDTWAMTQFQQAYGKEPTEVNVLLPYPTLEENFQTCKEEYKASSLLHRCDGEICEVIQKDNEYLVGTHHKIPCPGNCKEVGRLQMIIPELKRFAYVTAETHSINDIINLTQQLQAIALLFGRLNNIPMVLSRRPEKISTKNEKGERSRRESWLLHIEISPEWASLQIEAGQIRAMQQAQTYQAIGGSQEPIYQLPAAKQPYSTPPSLPDFKVSSEPFENSRAWQEFEGYLEDCNTFEKTENLLGWVNRRIEQGHLPKAAKAIAERRIRIREEILQSATVSMAELTAVPAQVEVMTDEF